MNYSMTTIGKISSYE